MPFRAASGRSGEPQKCLGWSPYTLGVLFRTKSVPQLICNAKKKIYIPYTSLINCTEGAPTHSVLHPAQSNALQTVQIANCSYTSFSLQSPPVVLPVECTSGPHGHIQLLPHPFLSSHHAPKKSISKPGISSSRLPNALAHYPIWEI